MTTRSQKRKDVQRMRLLFLSQILFAFGSTAFVQDQLSVQQSITPNKSFLSTKSSAYKKPSRALPLFTMKTSKDISKKVLKTTPSNISTELINLGDSKGRNDETDIIPASERALGLLVLATVPCAWGTFAPVVRYVYELEVPLPGFVFSAGYYLVAAITLNSILFFQGKWDGNNDLKDEQKYLKGIDDTGTDSTVVMDTDSSPFSNMPIVGGLELGMYLFLGNCFQVIGLESVSADRAAFLVQLTTVFVPLLQAFLLSYGSGQISKFFQVIPLQTWFACLLAFSGVIVMEFDNGGNDPSASISTLVQQFTNENGNLWDSLLQSLSSLSSLEIGLGDISILIAAIAYTFHVVRLSKYANETTPLKLASCKATTEAILSVLLVAALWIIPSDIEISSISKFSGQITNFFQAYSLTTLPTQAFLACLWTGWVTCAYTIYAQSFGQKRVRNPTFANLIYTTQPLFSAAFAWFLLDETLGFWGFIGGGLIGIALALITLAEESSVEMET